MSLKVYGEGLLKRLILIRGDILLLSDEKGNPVARYDYDPYGNIVGTQVTTTTLLSDLSFNTNLTYTQPLRYASYFFDTQTNLYYLSQRYYDPETYQFLSKDPEKADGEESAYQYCSNDPVNYVDPDGIKKKSHRHKKRSRYFKGIEQATKGWVLAEMVAGTGTIFGVGGAILMYGSGMAAVLVATSWFIAGGVCGWVTYRYYKSIYGRNHKRRRRWKA